MHDRINFNEDTLNIFTDASVITQPYGFDSCSAVCAIAGDNDLILDETVHINRNCTNNFGEMYAIYLGVLLAYKYIYLNKRNFNIINIFSDSAVSVLGLKEWIYNWKLDKDGLLINSSNKPVANQSLICSIVNTIYKFDLNISFFHIKGHVNYNSDNRIKVLNTFIHKFRDLNKDIGPGLIDYPTMERIIKYNDYVDNLSRDHLRKYYDKNQFIIFPIEKRFDPNWDLEEYRKLINPNS